MLGAGGGGLSLGLVITLGFDFGARERRLTLFPGEAFSDRAGGGGFALLGGTAPGDGAGGFGLALRVSLVFCGGEAFGLTKMGFEPRGFDPGPFLILEGFGGAARCFGRRRV